ncbi:MAG: RnfABCDGE type electron transport complex subunit G [Thermodesulfobacteriota bacterium]
MNKSIKMVITLTVLGALAGIILAFVFRMADPLIQINKEKELKAAIFTVLPEAKDYRTLTKELKDEIVTVYVGLDAKGEAIGVSFKADGNGFQGNVGIMVGLGLDYEKLKGIEVLDQVETPGLGDRIREEGFKAQFKGVEIHPKIEYIKYRKPEKPYQIQAITGATISSNAVVVNINNAVKKVTELFTARELRAAASAGGGE